MTTRNSRRSLRLPRFWWASILFVVVLVLTTVHLIDTIAKAQQQDALMGPFLECVDREGATYVGSARWVKAGGRPLITAADGVTEQDLAIHEACWQLVLSDAD